MKLLRVVETMSTGAVFYTYTANRRDAASRVTFLRNAQADEMKRGNTLLKTVHIEKVLVPTQKDSLIYWLNQNASRAR